MTTFQKVALGSLVQVVRGISYKSSELSDGDRGLPMVNLRNVGKGGGFRADGLKRYTGRYKPSQVLEAGDLVLANTDLSKAKDVLGSTFLLPASIAGAVLSLDLSKLVPDESVIDKRFLNYFLHSPTARSFMKEHGQGITVTHLRMSALPNLEVPVPPLDEQKRIVEALDGHLSRLDKTLADLEERASQIEKLTESFRYSVVTGSYSDAAIPFSVTTLGKVAKWSSGGTPQSGNPKYYGGEIPWCVIGDLTESKVSSTAKSITEAGLASSSAKIVPSGTVLLAMYGASIGRTGIAAVQMATNQAVACANPFEGIDAEYLLLFLQSQKRMFVNAGKGGAQPNISQTIIKDWAITLPPLNEQKRLISEVVQHQESTQRLKLQNLSMKNELLLLRKSVLNAAFTGHLEI